MAQDSQTRARIRALVRDVLENTPDAPAQDVPATPAAPPSSSSTANTISTAPAKPVETKPNDDDNITRDESEKSIITELDLRDLPEGARVRVRENVRLTPLAADIIRERRIELVSRVARKAQSVARSIAIGADHGGFETKQKLQTFLTAHNNQVRDFGTHSTDVVDYPDIAFAVARAVADGTSELGIIIDGAGIGSAMTANKVKGIRAAACYTPALARNSREHNGANVLTLGSSINTFDEIQAIVTAWLTSDLREERHRKRVAKIEAIEREHAR